MNDYFEQDFDRRPDFPWQTMHSRNADMGFLAS